jgi:hypothetical protein
VNDPIEVFQRAKRSAASWPLQDKTKQSNMIRRLYDILSSRNDIAGQLNWQTGFWQVFSSVGATSHLKTLTNRLALLTESGFFR